MVWQTTLSRRLVLSAMPAVPAAALTAEPALAGGKRKAPSVGRRAAAPLPLVVLDPGHGGKDPGAIGITGTYEKHIAFAAAQELRRQLLKARICRVALTRSRDDFLPLRERVAIAQGQGAALFMSMHADALSDPAVRGASVYTLADAASDPQTADLARRENSADRYGGPRFRDQSPVVAGILSDLLKAETRVGSAQMAHDVVAALTPEIGLLNRPSRHARFAVLRAADIPSVLVEMGFMSNRSDEAALRRPDHRSRIAASLRGAIETFLASSSTVARLAAG